MTGSRQVGHLVRELQRRNLRYGVGHDGRALRVNVSVAPFKVAILNLKQGDAATDAASEQL